MEGNVLYIMVIAILVTKPN